MIKNKKNEEIRKTFLLVRFYSRKIQMLPWIRTSIKLFGWDNKTFYCPNQTVFSVWNCDKKKFGMLHYYFFVIIDDKLSFALSGVDIFREPRTIEIFDWSHQTSRNMIHTSRPLTGFTFHRTSYIPREKPSIMPVPRFGGESPSRNLPRTLGMAIKCIPFAKSVGTKKEISRHICRFSPWDFARQCHPSPYTRVVATLMKEVEVDPHLAEWNRQREKAENSKQARNEMSRHLGLSEGCGGDPS